MNSTVPYKRFCRITGVWLAEDCIMHPLTLCMAVSICHHGISPFSSEAAGMGQALFEEVSCSWFALFSIVTHSSLLFICYGQNTPSKMECKYIGHCSNTKISNTCCIVELVIKTTKTKHESTGSIWSTKLFPSLLYLRNAAPVWPHRFSHPPLLAILYFERAEIIMFLLAKKGFSCHVLTTASWNEPWSLVQSTVALMDTIILDPTVCYSCWHD